jgi:hypothetical protein
MSRGEMPLCAQLCGGPVRRDRPRTAGSDLSPSLMIRPGLSPGLTTDQWPGMKPEPFGPRTGPPASGGLEGAGHPGAHVRRPAPRSATRIHPGRHVRCDAVAPAPSSSFAASAAQLLPGRPVNPRLQLVVLPARSLRAVHRILLGIAEELRPRRAFEVDTELVGEAYEVEQDVSSSTAPRVAGSSSRACASSSHWNGSNSSAASTASAVARLRGEWNWSQSRSAAKVRSSSRSSRNGSGMGGLRFEGANYPRQVSGSGATPWAATFQWWTLRRRPERGAREMRGDD